MAFFDKSTLPPTDEQQAQKVVALLKKIASANRRRRMQKRIDFFYDVQEQYLIELIDDQFKFPDRLKLQKEFFNLTELIIDEIAFIYNEVPLREIQEGTEEDTTVYADIVEKSQLNQVMQQVNQFAKLCKTVAVKPVWRDERIQYDIFTPNIYDVFQDKLNPTEAIAFTWGTVLDIKNEESTNNDNKKGKRDPWDEKQNLFYYMDKVSFIVFTLGLNTQRQLVPTVITNVDNPANVNPYGVLPFVTLRDGIPIDQYFLEGGDDLVSTNEIVNIKLTELNYLTKMQSFSIPVRKGAGDKADSIILDPSLTIDLPGDDDVARNADFKFASPDAKIDEVQASIDAKIKRLALKRKLSPERFVTSALKSSAEALQLRAWDQAKILKKDKPFYADFEKRLFEMTRIIWNHHNPGKQISENATLFIDYKEVETPMTVEERDTHNITMHNNGLISKTKWLMEENPDIKDEEQAEEMLQKIADEKKAELETLAPQLVNPNNPIPDEEDEPEEDNE